MNCTKCKNRLKTLRISKFSSIGFTAGCWSWVTSNIVSLLDHALNMPARNGTVAFCHRCSDPGAAASLHRWKNLRVAWDTPKIEFFTAAAIDRPYLRWGSAVACMVLLHQLNFFKLKKGNTAFWVSSTENCFGILELWSLPRTPTLWFLVFLMIVVTTLTCWQSLIMMSNLSPILVPVLMLPLLKRTSSELCTRSSFRALFSLTASPLWLGHCAVVFLLGVSLASKSTLCMYMQLQAWCWAGMIFAFKKIYSSTLRERERGGGGERERAGDRQRERESSSSFQLNCGTLTTSYYQSTRPITGLILVTLVSFVTSKK